MFFPNAGTARMNFGRSNCNLILRDDRAIPLFIFAFPEIGVNLPGLHFQPDVALQSSGISVCVCVVVVVVVVVV